MNKKLFIISAVLISTIFFAACNKNGAQFSPKNNELVGTWKTDCLVPDPKSPWAERHTFVINADNTATHTREAFYAPACGGSGDTATNRYSYNVVGNCQIDFMDLDAGVPFYDVYSLNGNRLLFGHGFRIDAVFGGSGATPEDRIHILNNYIAYKK